MFSSLFFILLIQTGLIVSSKVELKALMPNVSPKTPDLYLCHKVKLDENQPVYITEFEAKSTKEIAHHILLFACSDPGPEETWNCGEMSHKSNDHDFKAGPVCQSKQSIIFAWALDAPKLVLPEDVAFKLGGNTNNKYLVVQVHYANVDMFKDGKNSDDSGIILKGQTEPVSKLAGVYLMGTGGYISANTDDNFETACVIRENVEMHPFAYRTHAHKLAKVNSGYLVQNDKSGEQKWTEIGRRSPQLPQMFFPATNQVVVKKGDILAARCTMHNFRDHTVRIGATGEDEMCNFYIMYWVKGDRLINDNVCFSNGPPNWYFKDFWSTSGSLDLDMIPKDASEVPKVQLEELEQMEKSGGMHGMDHSKMGKHEQQEDHSNMDHSKMGGHEQPEDHSSMDHSNMGDYEHLEHQGKSKNTNKIIDMILSQFGSGNKPRFHKRRFDQSDELETDLDDLEKAYLVRKILNQIRLK